MKRGPAAALLAATGLAVVALLAVASGVVPLKASSGHWAATRWVLRTVLRRSVATHSAAITAPPLTESWLVAKGAAHYEAGCSPCHGSPARRRPRGIAGMTPPPPPLAARVGEWSNEELFYIVKHGVKFTGMPAWPAPRRDDEVWAMVAFLRELPALEAEQYLALAGTTAAAGCERCHAAGSPGRRSGAVPRLAGQKEDYLAASLIAFARGERHSGIMEPVAADLGPGEVRRLARFYAGLEEPTAAETRAAPAAAARGEAIARLGIPARNVPVCASCHGPGGRARNPLFPELGGQAAEYLALQLELFARGNRGGTPYAVLHATPQRLTDHERRDVAAYYAAVGEAAE